MVHDMLLETRSLTKEFRGFRAVSDVDLVVRDGTIHALVGPNGAGKTTLLNLPTGFLGPTSGSVHSAGLASLAGGVFAISQGSCRCRSSPGRPPGRSSSSPSSAALARFGAARSAPRSVVSLEDWLASSGFEGTGIILGGIFVLIVLLFRHRVWGTARQVVSRLQRRRRQNVRRGVRPT
jgi:energy-coupling factor transporter ATP-binding protein EcfA2